MATKVSMEDIAKRVKVSRATVSYVLNGREGEFISEATRIRVLQASQELGYRPNRAAQVLRGQRSYQVEFCVRDVHPAYYSRTIQEFQKQVESTRYQLHLVNTRLWTEENWESADGDWPMDGILTFDTPLSERVVRALKQRGVPVVNTGVVFAPDMDHVIVDFREATLEAIRHLLASGRKRVAHMTQNCQEDFAVFPGDIRYPVYLETMKEAGLQPENIVIHRSGSGLDRNEIYMQTREYVATHGHPEAIFCSNDEMSITAMCALLDMGLRVPEDVALVGCDGIVETRFHRPSLSTIEFPYAEMARTAWDFLLKRIENPALPLQSARLQARLVVRQSSS